MITERLMANGDFTLKFTRDAGLWHFGRILPWGTIAITNTALDLTTNTWATIVKNSLYLGTVDSIDQKERSIRGQGIACLLGSSDRGPTIKTAITKTSATLDAWLTDIIPGGSSSNGITKGSVTNTGTNVTDSLQYVTRRAAVEKICAAAGAEWKVTPNASTGAVELSAGPSANLFANYTTPTSLVVRGGASRDPGTKSGRVIDLSNAVDVEDYVTEVTAIGRGDGGAEVVTSTGSVVYYGPFGHSLDMGVIVDAPEVKRGQTSNFAAAVLAKRSSPVNTTRLSTDTYNLPADVKPGDRIAVFDPEQGLYDTANSIIYEGRQVNPIYVRVVGWTWPKRPKMGVYYRLPGSPDVVVDLSEVIEDETGAAVAEIGAWSRSIGWTPSTVAGSPSVTGDTPKVTVLDAWTSHTPTLTGITLVNGAVESRWTRDGMKVIFAGSYTVGSSDTFSGVSFRFSLPVNARSARHLGHAEVEDASASFVRTVGGSEVNPGVWGQNVIMISTGVGAWSNTSPQAIGAGDVFTWQIVYEPAAS